MRAEAKWVEEREGKQQGRTGETNRIEMRRIFIHLVLLVVLPKEEALPCHLALPVADECTALVSPCFWTGKEEEES